jgi:drug/metabolite transporter (DMT)-like permease
MMTTNSTTLSNTAEQVLGPVAETTNSNKKAQLLGLVWKLVACFAFASVNAIVRYLTGGAHEISNPLSADVITFFQNIFAFCLMVPFIMRKGLGSLKTKRELLPKHCLRILSAVTGIICLYSAFAKMPMTQAVALQFVGPIFSVIMASVYLSERLNFYRILSIILALTGAFIISRPDHAILGMSDSLGWYALLPLGSAITFAIAKILGRELGMKGESASLLSFYLIFFMIPASAIPALIHWVTPSWSQLGYLLLLGACGCLAHYSTSKAYCLAEVNFLTPYGFARIIFTAVLGYVLFQEFPTNSGLWVGFIFIMTSTFCMTAGETEKRRQKALKPFSKPLNESAVD